jgi:hypothetical protein
MYAGKIFLKKQVYVYYGSEELRVKSEESADAGEGSKAAIKRKARRRHVGNAG